MVPLLNIHTHTPLHEGEQTIPAYGLHPWLVDANWKERLADVERDVAAHRDGPFMIGECGLDRLYRDTYELQLKAMQAHIQLSERLAVPMIVHCVKAFDDLLRLHRQATLPWIIHGFRGNPQQLAQLLSHGLYVSFGYKYNRDSLLACPLDRMFLETDDTALPIAPLYEQVAEARDISIEQLATRILSTTAALPLSV